MPEQQNQQPQKKRGPQVPVPKMPRGDNFWTNLALSIFILMLLAGAYTYFSGGGKQPVDIPISAVAQDVGAGKVTTITVNGDDLKIEYADKTEKISKKEPDTALTQTLTNYGVAKDALDKVTITIQRQSSWEFWLSALAPFLAPLLLIAFFVWYLSRQVRGAGMQAFSFGQSKPRVIDPNDKVQRITFKDVAGAKEAKIELHEIVDFLKNPKKFLDIGARIPKGILLMGAPGTGKTMLARAVAGEAGVPFFSISGSEFVEMFVGVGASRVRDLFLTAKRAAPAIIFLDEIDAVGRIRGTGVGGGNDEREQTLNQILVEMDGFEPNEKVIVMAATNRPDVLDPALVRPGRFDRRVVIDLPDRADRVDILTIHARRKPLAEDVNLAVIAERTPGFSGADLANLMNEAAILAARENRRSVAQYDLVRSIEKVMLGPERKTHVLNAKEKEITAYHEAGHALVASLLPYADPVHKISIISRGRAAGYTLKLPFEDKRMQSRKEFLDDIAMSLGGYVAELEVFDDVTTGPSNDLQVSTALARDMVTRFGMSEKVGTIALVGEGGRAMFGTGIDGREYSEKVSAEIDAEVKKLMDGGYKKAHEIITKHRRVLDAIAHRLIEVETIEREEFEQILTVFGIEPKRKIEIEEVPLRVDF